MPMPTDLSQTQSLLGDQCDDSKVGFQVLPKAQQADRRNSVYSGVLQSCVQRCTRRMQMLGRQHQYNQVGEMAPWRNGALAEGRGPLSIKRVCAATVRNRLQQTSVSVGCCCSAWPGK
jgi:hypothetical protein